MPTTLVETNAARKPLEALKAELAVIVGGNVKDGHAVSRGDVLGVITSGGQLRRRSRTVATGGFDHAADTGTVEDATVFKAGDVLTKDDGTTIGTVESVTAPHTVKLTANAAHDIAEDDVVIATDGSATAAAIADLGSDGVGDTSIPVFIGGYLNESLLNGLDDDAKTELGGHSMLGGIFKF